MGVSPVWVDAPASVQPILADAEDSEARGRIRVARELYELALHEWDGGTSRLSGGAIARTMRRVARCLVEEGDLDGALDVLEAARVTAALHGDRAGVAHAINLEGIIARQRGDLRVAERSFQEGRSIAWHAGDKLLVAMIDQNLGTVANIRGDLVEAKLRYEGSLAAYRVLNMSRAVGPLHNNLGLLHTDLRQWRDAEEHYRHALRGAMQHGDVAERLRTDANRAEMYVTRRRFRKAKQLCRRVITLGLAPDACTGAWLDEAFKHLGVAHRETGHADEAERCFVRSLELAEHREDALLTAEILYEWALLLQGQGRHQEMLTALTRAHALFGKLTARHDLADVDRQLRSLEEKFLEIVRAWGESIESADSYTQGHCCRVAELACELARDVNLDEATLLWFRMGALLHDVGKLVVPKEVINKAGALTPSEMELMRVHPEAGAAIVGNAGFPWDIRPMIKYHHERWNGTGYPHGLEGTQIPLTARILCIADVYDALTSTRSYREAYTPETAAAIMRAECGQTFDPELLETFLERTLPRLQPVSISFVVPLEAVA